jgi:hypothetical protein
LNHGSCGILDTAEERNMNTLSSGIVVRTHLHDQCTGGGIVRILRAAFSACYNGYYDSKYSYFLVVQRKDLNPAPWISYLLIWQTGYLVLVLTRTVLQLN